MERDEVRLRPRKGDEAVGHADITKLSSTSRGIKVVLWLLFGVAGMATIVIPSICSFAFLLIYLRMIDSER